MYQPPKRKSMDELYRESMEPPKRKSLEELYRESMEDAQVEREFAGQSSAASREMPAQRELAPRESTRVATPSPRQPTMKAAPLSAGQIAGGALRSAVQGLSFGFGEEAEAALTGRPVQEIRGEMREFREQYPKTAFVTELGGGALTGGLGAARGAAAMAGRTLLRRGAETFARSAAPAALAGAGQAEEGNRLQGAITGGVSGGVAGTALAPVATRLASTFSRAGARPDAVAQEIAGLSLRANLPADQLGQRAAWLSQVAPDARVGDVIGRPAMRRLRGIAALGGEPGERVEQTMVERIAGRPERMQQALTRATGKAAEDILETTDEIIARRSQQAKALYDQVRENPPLNSPELERLIASRPSLRRATQQAQNLAAEEGVSLPMMDTPAGPVPLRTAEFLDYTKRALDDMLYRGKMPGEGGLGRAELAAIGKTRAELMDLLDDALPGYREARNAFAGETALKSALEDGATLASKRPGPNEIRRMVSELGTDSEREMFQRGYLDGLRGKIDADQLKPNEIRTPKFAKTLEAVFGPEQGAQVREALLEDVNLVQAATAITSGARTAPLAVDIADEMAESQPIAQTIRAYIEPRRALARGIGRLENIAYGQGREGTRAARAEALLRPASDIGPLLSRIAQEQEMQRRIARRGTGAAATFGQYIGGATGRSMSGG